MKLKEPIWALRNLDGTIAMKTVGLDKKYLREVARSHRHTYRMTPVEVRVTIARKP